MLILIKDRSLSQTDRLLLLAEKITKIQHVMTLMICSSSVGHPNTLYYASTPIYDDNIIQVLVEQKARDIDLNIYSSTVLCRRAVVVRTRRGDYGCPEPIETATIALLLKTLGSSTNGALFVQMRLCLKALAEDEPWCRERMEIVRRICAAAETAQGCDIRPRAQPDLGRYRHRLPVIANASAAPLTEPSVSDAPTTPPSSDGCLGVMAGSVLAKRVSKLVQRYNPRSRTSPKKTITK